MRASRGVSGGVDGWGGRVGWPRISWVVPECMGWRRRVKVGLRTVGDVPRWKRQRRGGRGSGSCREDCGCSASERCSVRAVVRPVAPERDSAMRIHNFVRDRLDRVFVPGISVSWGPCVERGLVSAESACRRRSGSRWSETTS